MRNIFIKRIEFSDNGAVRAIEFIEAPAKEALQIALAISQPLRTSEQVAKLVNKALDEFVDDFIAN